MNYPDFGFATVLVLVLGHCGMIFGRRDFFNREGVMLEGEASIFFIILLI